MEGGFTFICRVLESSLQKVTLVLGCKGGVACVCVCVCVLGQRGGGVCIPDQGHSRGDGGVLGRLNHERDGRRQWKRSPHKGLEGSPLSAQEYSWLKGLG